MKKDKLRRFFFLNRPAHHKMWLISTTYIVKTLFYIVTLWRKITTFFERKLVNSVFPVSLTYCFGCSKEPSH